MGAFVLEIQNNTLLSYYHTAEEVESGVAKQDFYQKCGVACVSSVARHTIILMREDGQILQQEVFFHPNGN